MVETGTAEVVPLTLQVIRGMEEMAAGQRELVGVLERGLAQIEAQDREALAEGRAARTDISREIRVLSETVKLYTVAIEARTGLMRELSGGVLGWLNLRWVTLLMGLGFGLGLAGAKALIAVLFGQVVPGVTPGP